MVLCLYFLKKSPYLTESNITYAVIFQDKVVDG